MLIELKTKLKSLKFGQTDKPGGKALNDEEKEPGRFAQQPYIRKEIPDADGSFVDDNGDPIIYTGPGILGTGGPDIIIRGGALSVTRSIKDVSRLTQMFADTTNGARGIQYTVKENILSKTSVRTEASKGPLNQGTYTPLSTISQGAANAFGGHVNHLGLLPFDNVPGTVPKYENVFHSEIEGDQKIETNRLYQLYQNQIDAEGSSNSSLLGSIGNFIAGTFGDTEYFPNKTTILKYPGGPSSIGGVGETIIKTAEYTIGKRWDRSKWNDKGPLSFEYTTAPVNGKTSLTIFSSGRGDSGVKHLNILESDEVNSKYGFNVNSSIFKQGKFDTLRSSPSFWSELNLKDDKRFDSNVYNQTTPQVTHFKYTSSLESNNSKPPSDFRTNLKEYKDLESSSTPSSTVLSLSPAYNDSKKNIHGRVNLGDPGNPQDKNVWNYTTTTHVVDKITNLGLYESSNVDTSQPVNDLVKFRIKSLNNSGDGSGVYMHFRAFIDNFSDSYNATWNPVNYVGRGDTLYNYGNFGRTINMNFTVAAQSKPELIPMYKKLNYLASTLTPDYSSSGFMRGNMIQLTMGGYLLEQPGFLTSLTYDVPQESPWEIGIDVDGKYDSTVKELPHVIKVNMTFTPIHNFLPKKVEKYGKGTNERYIALSTGVNNKGNYND